MNTIILIVCHKPYNTPKIPGYFPIEVGARLHQKHFEKLRDDTGDNISEKNPTYCELTALYWAWKNLTCDIVGLMHYRRYISSSLLPIIRPNCSKIIKEKQIINLLKKYDFILPKMCHLKETNYDHGNHYYPDGKDVIFNDHHFDLTRESIKRLCPEYLNSFDKVMKSNQGHYLNMFIAKKELSDKYCQWLFPILSDVESRFDFTYNPYPESRRVFGYISENLLDVFIDKNKYSYIERQVNLLENGNILTRIKRKIK